LARIDTIEGLSRIRFTTSHPKDLSAGLIDAFGRLDKLCHHIHLPVQSGDDAILKRMNRKYTRGSYLEKIGRLRDSCPDIAITSDVIVGFPGESDRQFQATLELIETVRFDGLFAFMYSDRPNAPATAFAGKVAESVKKGRLQTLLELQARITREKHHAMVGQTRQVLVEGVSRDLGGDRRKADAQSVRWTGRTSTNHIVHFIASGDRGRRKQVLTGTLAEIMIEGAHAHSLWGRLVRQPIGAATAKGDSIIAA
jgi:tRNA-2-methylthio-N6-dimethylallyladenosine synthase